MTTPFMLTAAAYWEARQREGWMYHNHPRKQWYAVHRLGNHAYTLAAHLQCLEILDCTTSPIRYPGDLLDAAWERLVAQGLVHCDRRGRQVEDEVGVHLS